MSHRIALICTIVLLLSLPVLAADSVPPFGYDDAGRLIFDKGSGQVSTLAIASS
jgi:hypothetical protein